MPTRILIVDDHHIVREGVRSLLKAVRPDWVLTEAENGSQAVNAVSEERPDLIVMDITMPALSGLEVAVSLRGLGFQHPILMFTMHYSEQLTNDVQKVGAQGYVLKSQAVEDLVQAIDILLAGGTFYGKPSHPSSSPEPRKSGLSFLIGLVPALAS